MIATGITVVYVSTAVWLDCVGQRDPGGAFDAIIVLGCRVDRGGVASQALTRRTRHAVRLYWRGLAPTLVFTGGVGEHPPSEARVAADLAAKWGVPTDAMVLEERSTSTEENASRTKELLDVTRVLLVTDAYHTFRSQRVFARYFDDVSATGSTGAPGPRMRGALREVGAVAIYALLGRL